jgi:hypothetical protein
VIDECPRYGDRPLEYDDTCRQEDIVANMSSSDDETIETAHARLTAETKTHLEEQQRSGKFLQE